MGDNRYEEHEIKGKRTTVKKADVKPGKIYVGRLPSVNDTSDEYIRNYFADHGTVTEYIRPIDKMKDNELKNFAFISFEKEAVSKMLIQMGTVVINCHEIIIKEVNPNPRDGDNRYEEHEIKGERTTVKKADQKPGKIYIKEAFRHISGVLSDDDIRNYFAGHGTVTEFIRPIDKMKDNEPKNFAFITFENEAVSKKLIQIGSVVINGHRFIVKEVNPNPCDGVAGRGGGRGGYPSASSTPPVWITLGKGVKPYYPPYFPVCPKNNY